MENVVFGVYFGNTSFCVAIGKDSSPEIVTNDSGERITSSAMYIDCGEKLVGLAAKQNFTRKAENTIIYNKYFLGLNFTEMDPILNNFYVDKLFSAAKIEIEDYNLVYKVQDSSISPFDVLCGIYCEANEIAKKHIKTGQKDFPAVISVPYGFENFKQSLVKEAAEAAGFKVLRVISEASAAMFAYDVGQEDNSETSYCIVCHVGGQSTKITIARVSGGLYQILFQTQDLHLGGDYITELLLKSCANDFLKQWKLDPLKNHRSKMKLFAACENCKHILSNQGSSQCYVESLSEGVDYQSPISRAKFEMLITPFLSKLRKKLVYSLEECKLDISSIKKVILCGGSCKIPSVQSLFSALFPDSQILSSISPDEVYAYGNVKECLLLHGMSSHQQTVKSHVPALSKALALKVNNVFLNAFSIFTPIPSRTSLNIPHENSSSVLAEIYEIDGSGKHQFIAKIELLGLANKCDIIARLSVSSDGSLHVTLFDSISQNTSSITVEGEDPCDLNDDTNSENIIVA